MYTKKRQRTYLYWGLIVIGLLALTMALATRPALADVLPQSAFQQLQAAWQRAGASAQYTYQSTILQTTTPTAQLSNAGRSSHTQRIRIDGSLDKPADTMQMQMQVGQQPPIAVKITDGHSYGRQGDSGEWIELEQTPDLFAPGGDPLGFLAAMENVRTLGPREKGMDDFSMPAELQTVAYDSEGITRYAYELSGPKFAGFMKQQMEAELRRKGELPPSMSLSAATQYVEMTGHGELWVGADGLPARLLIHVAFPAPQGTDDQIAADISTTFSGWAEAAPSAWSQLWHDPTLLMTQPAAVTGVSAQAAQQVGFMLGLALFTLGLVALTLTNRRRWAVRAVIYSITIISMLVTPLLQSQQVSAFYDGQQARALETSAASTDPVTHETAFNPHANPMQSPERVAMANPASQSAAQPAAQEAAPAASINRAATAQAAATCTVTDSSDCDGDGLLDQVEIHQLGTFVDDIDSDDDYISDYMEVQGFTVGGQTWYLDPRSADSNGDGLLDTNECLQHVDVAADGTLDPITDPFACIDFDNDGIPDVYDFDNDGDGVPDSADSAPYAAQSVTDGQFALSLSGYQSDKSLAVTFQIRPADDRHLWWANTYLDWPDNDIAGQVRRVTTDTITSDVTADMQLSPVLEIELPYSAANPSRGLPILSGVDISAIGQTTPTSDWLDRNALLPYAITVGEVNPDDGALYAYLPLGVVEDRNGDSPVALTGIMHYKMPAAAGGWGADHQVRLLWLVNGLNDSCDAPEELSTDEANAYCEDDANWISEKTLLQSYYDDFSVTGLQVEESHGSSAAVFAQKNNSSAYDPQLWHLADVLQATFLTHSIDPSTSQRLTVGNIDQHLTAWGVGNLYVNEVLNAVDEPTLMSDLTGDNVSTMLNAARSSAATGDYAELLYAVELSGRSVRLGELAATFDNNAFNFDLTNADLTTEGLLRWKPYRYTVGGWQDSAIASTADTDTFISALETALDSTFTTARLDTILDVPPADYDRVRQGAKMLAVNYYMSHYIGLASTLESSGLTPGAQFVDGNYPMPDDPATAIVGRLAGIIQDYYAQISLSNLAIATNDAEIEGVANSTWASLSTSATAILTGIGDLVDGEKSSLAIALQAMDAIGVPEGATGLADGGALAMSKSTVHVLEVGVASVKLAHVILHASESIPRAWKYYSALQEAKYTVQSLQISSNYAKAQDWVSIPGAPYSSDYKGMQNALDNAAAELEPKYLKAAKVGLAVELATIAFEFALTLAIEKIPLDSTEFNQLIAHTIAAVVVAVVQFAIIVSNPGFAILFVFVHIFDAIFSLICTISGEDKKEVTYDTNGIVTYVLCHGIAGTVTQGLTYLLNDTTLLMDLENENQFEPFFGISNITVADGAGGFAVGNTLTLSAIITATAYTGKPNWMGYIYNWQLRDENVKETAVDFRLQTSEADFDKDLSFGDTAWERPADFDPDKDIRRDDLGTPTNPQPGKRYEAVFQPTLDHTLSDAGVNVGLSGVYFSQAVRVKKQDCWLAPVGPFIVFPFCGTDEVFDHTFHKELDDVFIVDVFPATLDDFRALAQDVAGQPGIRLAWDETFPVLMDADGDGLVSGAFNGPDPDDSNPDTDGDGLSDFYEIQNGFDATAADEDCDGLTDYWEVFYNTDPKHSDSDHDGLIDSREVFHPNIRYPYENSVFTNTTAPACAVDAGLTAAHDGGWEIVYAFDGNTPLSLRVSADPNDPDSDDDGLTDRQEEVYGYSPHAPSELDVLTLETSWTMQHPENMPYLSTTNTNGGYGNFTYEATVTNDLTGRYLRGLLETEFPVDSVISTREVDILAPAASTTLTGTVNMDDLAITTSQVTSLTLRAGAIVDLPDDHLVWLPMNERVGADILVDKSVNGYDGGVGSVTLNGRNAYFPICNSQVKPGFVEMPADGITVGLWFNMTDVSNASNMKLLSGGTVGDLLLVSAAGAIATPGTAWTTTTVATGEWHHAALTITGSQTRLYLDGRLQATAGGKNLGSAQLFTLGSNSCNNSLYRPFYLDNFEIFDRVLSDAELLTAYGRESLATSLESTGNGVSCSGARCPTLNDAGATFDQTQHLTVDTSSLNFSDNQFSIVATVKPVNRAHPFNSTAGAHFGIDTSQDWQGVYGYEDPSNPNLIFPSLYVGSNGALRVKMGDGVDTCTYQTANGIVNFNVEQQVLVSFDGNAFTIFVDGVERATGAPTACASVGVPSTNSIYVGRPNVAGYLYFEKLVSTGKIWDGPVDSNIELRINLDSDDAAGNIWQATFPIADGAGKTYTFDTGVRYLDDETHGWLFWENDIDPSLECCNSNTLGTSHDDAILRLSSFTNVYLAAQTSSIDRGDGSSEEFMGDLSWSNANEFFRGTVRNLRIYDYAVSAQGAERVYNTETFALQMNFDEAPGESRFVDESGNYFEAECASTNCPDSGIPGRTNQAARFDGGVADDDGNDGVADYLTLSADEEALGLQQHDFTIMAWVKPDQVDGFRRILAAGRAVSGNGVGFGTRDGNLLFTTFGIKDYRSTSSTVPTGTWSHVAVSFDANNDTHFYVNGQFIETITGTAPANLNSDDAYRIGATTVVGQATTSEVWDGLIDDLRILTYAADAATIQRMMNEAPLLNLHLDEDVNTTAFANDSLNGGTAVCTGATCPGAGDKGQLRESATFDGIDDSLTVSGSESLDLETYSVALWVKPTQKKSLWQPLIHKAKADTGQRTFALLINTESMTLRHSLQQSDCSTYTIRDSVGTLLLNQWNHVVMTFDGAQNSLYINGALDGSVAYQGTPCQNSEPVRLAYSTASTQTAFAGNLDEITIEGGALSAAQVQDLYLYQSAWYDEKQQHTVLIDADYPTSSVVLSSDYVQPGQVLLMDVQDPVVNGVASGISNAYYRIDGGDWVRVFPDNDGLYFVPAAATADLADGEHTIQLRATDLVAHRAEGAVQTMQIDTTAPTVGPGTNTLDGSVILVNSDSNQLYIKAEDAQGAIHSGIDTDSVQVSLLDHRGVLASGPLTASEANTTIWYADHRFATAPYGQYTYAITARDNAGNASSSSSTLWLDGLPGYGDIFIDTNIITGSASLVGSQVSSINGAGAVIGGVASDIPYPQSGRTLHLHFEEAAGATLFYDGSVNHLNTICSGNGCPTAGATGQEDGAASFDGGDYLTIGDQDGITAAEVLGLNGNFTIMAWVKPNGLSGTQQILAAQQTNSAGGIAFGLNGDKLRLQAIGAQEYQSSLAAGLAANTWSHVAALYNASTQDVTFYVNGELLETVDGTVDLVVNTDDAYRIGEGFSGSIDELVVYGANLGAEDIYNVVHPVSNNTSQVKVRYRHASGVVWPHLDPDGLALYLPLDEVLGSAEFDDLSIHGRNAACLNGQCPVAGYNSRIQSVETGSQLMFDGIDDYLTTPHVLDPAATDFTASLWFQVENLFNHNRPLLQQTDGSGAGRSWLYVTSDGKLNSFLGGSALTHSGQVKQSTWYHAAITYERATQTLTLYLDGAPVSTTRGLEASDGEMLLGTNKALGEFLAGQLDEVAIFDRALTAAEVGYLMGSPWHDASPAYNTESGGDTLGADDRLRDWSHTVPAGLEGPYKIDLLVADGPVPGHREGVSHAVWTGEIDTTAPRVALSYTLSADKSSVTIACAAADYNLSEEGWECPVDAANLSHHNKDAAWFTTIFSDTQKLAGFTTAEEVFTPGPDLHVTACDLWGQCTTLAPTDTDGDGILDHVEGDGDRDGDGILDAHDYDPDGHFYELGTGKIIPGGTVAVSGPGPVQVDPDGNTGYYDWTTDGTPGLYVMTVTPPAGYVVSPDCPAQPGAITPTGTEPDILGSSEVSSTETLADGSCAANPYYLQFNVAAGEPFVFNNNIPLTAIVGNLTHQLFLPILANDAVIPAKASSVPTDPTPAAEPPTEQDTADNDTNPADESTEVESQLGREQTAGGAAATLAHQLFLPLVENR